jgi:hypothetical protein
MKKLLLTGLVLCSALAAFAQTSGVERIHPQDTKIGGVLPKQRLHTANGDIRTEKRAETLSGQYRYVNSYGETQMIGDPTSYVRWMTVDTNSVTIFQSGESGRNYVHTYGSMFDPKDSSFQLTGQPVLTRFNPYTVDTIRWQQFYVRNADSTQRSVFRDSVVDRIQFRDSVVESTSMDSTYDQVNDIWEYTFDTVRIARFDTIKKAEFDLVTVEVVDTLYVQYFNFQGLSFAGLQGGSMLFGYPNPTTYRAGTLLNTSALGTDTILFRTGDGDSIDRFAGTLFASVNGVVPSNFKALSTNTAQVNANTTAFCLVFKPMVAHKFNDTFIDWSKPETKSHINGYGVRSFYWENQAVVSETPYRYNNTFWTTADLRNGLRNDRGWQSYYPTSIYTTSTLLGFWIDITTQNASVESLKNGVADLKVFPNPSTQGEHIVANFELADNAIVTVDVRDINGRLVSQQANQLMNRGINEVSIPTQNIAAGIYTLSIHSALGSQNTKFIVR